MVTMMVKLKLEDDGKLKLEDNKFEEYGFGYSIIFLVVSINESLIQC